MKPIGYIMQQHGVRLERPVKAYDKWVNRMPEEYARNLLGNGIGPLRCDSRKGPRKFPCHRQTLPQPRSYGTGNAQTDFSPLLQQMELLAVMQPLLMMHAKISRFWQRK